ncbi:hypothetical protein OH76DRAFT_1403738 [Lentinus brumalis]|uniref:Uncharacterized protein n=1 Tax=Lentinus brumalis TaxID=2498619 RepID=A0A371DAE0_9APHY|nr:hypothetical protein OH76DRAFT_1403738 [Polyporus brumalis]
MRLHSVQSTSIEIYFKVLTPRTPPTPKPGLVFPMTLSATTHCLKVSDPASDLYPHIILNPTSTSAQELCTTRTTPTQPWPPFSLAQRRPKSPSPMMVAPAPPTPDDEFHATTAADSKEA